MRRTARHLDLSKRACCRSYLLVELLDRLPLTLLVSIKVMIAYVPHVIPTLVFDGLEPGATKPSIGHQDRYALLGQHEFKYIEQLLLALGATFTIMHALVNRERSTGQRD